MGTTWENAVKYGNVAAMNHILKNTINFPGLQTHVIYYFGIETRHMSDEMLENKLTELFVCTTENN